MADAHWLARRGSEGPGGARRCPGGGKNPETEVKKEGRKEAKEMPETVACVLAGITRRRRKKEEEDQRSPEIVSFFFSLSLSLSLSLFGFFSFSLFLFFSFDFQS